MTDWNKLKVVDLKAELKKRGLAQTGLKPALVARLTSAETEDGSESETTVQGDVTKQEASTATSPDTISPIQQTSDPVAEVSKDAPARDVGKPMDETPKESVHPPVIVDEPLQGDSQPKATPPQISSTVEPPIEILDSHSSALPSVEPSEARDDQQKRKRRSESPPPAGSDSVRKRARQNETMVDMADNFAESKKQNIGEEEAGKLSAEEVVSFRDIGSATAITDFVAKEDAIVESDPATQTEDGLEDQMVIDTEGAQSKVDGTSFEPTDDSPLGTRASKYGDLFKAQQRRHSLDKSASRDFAPDVIESDEPDRIISPAIHPATSSLYIRDLMRPLNASTVQNYFAELATAPGQEIDLDCVTTFFLDPQRTHALVTFTSVSAASRVRSSLHGRKWPEESTRKALWVDFVPTDKVDKWIQEEQSSNIGGRLGGKKWEVSYDVDDDRKVTTLLQESFSRPQPLNRQPSRPSHLNPHAPFQPKGVEGAPLGPRAEQIRASPRVFASRTTLDQLFKHTETKPMLYWKPVAKEVADKRLDNIDSATSKAAQGQRLSGDINRYTFEDVDILVDRGPEIFPGIRPPPGGSGPRGGGYRGNYRVPDHHRGYESYRGDGGRNPRDGRRY